MQEFIDVDLSRRIQHPDGFIVAPATLARSGVQLYRAYELDLPGDPMRQISVFRPPDEVFAADALASYSGTAITNGHRGRVTPSNWREMADGIVMNPRRSGSYVRGDVALASESILDELARGKRQFSATYSADLEWRSGIEDGESYEAVQRNIRINSVALVSAARCGPACRIDDLQRQGGNMATRKVMLDGIPLELEDVGAAHVEKVAAQLAALQTKIAEQKAALEAAVKFGDAALPISNPAAIQAVIDDQARQIAELKRDVFTPAQRDALVAEWTRTLADARRLAPKLSTDGKTCAAIRREVVDGLYAGRRSLMDAILGGAAPKDADDERIRTAFAVLAAGEPAGSGSPDPVADALSHGMADSASESHQSGPSSGNGGKGMPLTADGTPDPDAARTAYLERLTGHKQFARP